VEVGSLIGVEGETFRDWRVGVIRRVTRTEEQQQRVGVQLLTQSSTLVGLRRPGAATTGKAPAPRPAVLISPKPDGQKDLDIAVAREVFDSNENLEMLIGDEIYLLRPKETIEHGAHYEVVRFAILRAVH
jgi:hypothetical protein